MSSVSIPPAFHPLFWDVDPAGISLPAHNDYVLERLMQRGGWDGHEVGARPFRT